MCSVAFLAGFVTEYDMHLLHILLSSHGLQIESFKGGEGVEVLTCLSG